MYKTVIYITNTCEQSYSLSISIDPTQDRIYGVPSKEGDFAQDCACAELILFWHVWQTHSGFHRHYTQTSPNFLILLKKGSSFMNVLQILNDLYTAHHNLLCICHQLKIRHLYGTFNFSTQCICMGTGSLFVYRFSLFSWKGAPSTKENCICGSITCTKYILSLISLSRHYRFFHYYYILFSFHWVKIRKVLTLYRRKLEGLKSHRLYTALAPFWFSTL